MRELEQERRQRVRDVPIEDEFFRLVAKLVETAARREEERREAEMRRRQSISMRARLADRAEALYIISIAAKLADMHPQTLRKYDREGLVSPSRSDGSRRMYSEDDLEQLQIVRRLTDDLGLNLNGVSLVLTLVARMKDMLRVLDSLPSSQSSHSIKTVTKQIRTLIRYLGAEE